MKTSKTVLTIGTFDIPHAGHISFLNKCLKYGDKLVIGVNSDEFVEKYKKKEPLFAQHERISILRKAMPEAEFFIHTGDFQEDVDYTLPDVIVIGNDWFEKDYAKQTGLTTEFLCEYDVDVVYVPYTQDISTTEIKRRLKGE